MTNAIDAPDWGRQQKAGLRRKTTIQQEGGRRQDTASGGDFLSGDIDVPKEEGT
jgi:hypothetical protein